MKYIWDKTKNEKNYDKHGVWFEEAQTVFADWNALEIFDESNSSEAEERYIVLGLSSKPRLLIVVYCERVDNEIRIFSARKADTKESRDYEKKL